MNYRTLKRSLIALIFIPFVGLGEGATKGFYLDTPLSAQTLQVWIVPTEVDLSDLDVRDAQNRPVSSASARARLRDLFVDNLYQIAVEPLSHETLEVAFLLEASSRLFKDSFFHFYTPPLRRFLEALSGGKNRIVHNVNKLWITFTVGAPTGPPHSSISQTYKPTSRLILRC
jgi:hypothetical protein